MRVLQNAELVVALADAGRVGSDLAGGCLGWNDPIGTFGSYVARRVSSGALAEWTGLFRGARMRRDLPRVGEWIVLWYGGKGKTATVATVCSPAEGAVLACCEGAMRPEGFARVLLDPARWLGDCASEAELTVLLAAMRAEMTLARVPGRGTRRVNGDAAEKVRRVGPPPSPPVAPPAAAKSRASNGRRASGDGTPGPAVRENPPRRESPSPVRARGGRPTAAERAEREAIVVALTSRRKRGKRGRYVRGRGNGIVAPSAI
jgi:hypothetical protein